MHNPIIENQPGRLAKTTGYYAAFIILGLSLASLGPTLPGLAEQTRSTLSQVSLLFIFRSLGNLSGALLGGRLYDRLPGQRVMGGVLLIMAVSLALVPGIPVLWLLAGILLILGIADGAVDVGGNTLIVWVHGKKVGPFMNGLHFFAGIGMFLSPVIFAQAILLSGGIAWGYRLLALLVLPAALFAFLQPSPTRPAPSINGSISPLHRSLVLAICAFFFVAVGLEGAFGGWVYTYAIQLNLGNAVTAAYLTSAYWGALTLGRLAGIPLSIRYPPRTLLLVDVVGCLFSLAVILVWHNSQTALWLGSLGLGFFIATVFPNALSFAGQHMTITGGVTSLFLVGASLGGMFFPWFIGQLIAPFSALSVMWVLGLVSLLALGVFAWMVSSARKAETVCEHSLEKF